MSEEGSNLRNSTLYKISGTKTFRLGSAKIFRKWGSNLQNVNKKMRQLYRSDEGKCLLQTDQSGAEALIVAYLCRAGNLRDLFIHNVNPHVFLAVKMFKDQFSEKQPELKDAFTEAFNTAIPELKKLPKWKEIVSLCKESDNWEAKERYYYLSKQTNHSANYDVKEGAFIMNVLLKSEGAVVLSQQLAGELLQGRRKLFPEIQEWHYKVQNEVRNKGMIRNLFGFPFQMTDYLSEEAYKELYAWIPQSTVGSITNIAFTNLQNYIEDNNLDWDLLNNSHDSYLLQCPVDEKEHAHRKMKEFMEIKMISPVDGVEFNMKSETSCGLNWAPYNEKKNPEGLKEFAA